MVGQSDGHSLLPVHLHLHARQTDIEITVSTSDHGWTHGEGRVWPTPLRTNAFASLRHNYHLKT